MDKEGGDVDLRIDAAAQESLEASKRIAQTADGAKAVDFSKTNAPTYHDEQLEDIQEADSNNESASKLEFFTCGLCRGRRSRKAMTPRLEFKEQPVGDSSAQSTPRPAKKDQDVPGLSTETSEGADAERAVSEGSILNGTKNDESEEAMDANSRHTSIQPAELGKRAEEQDTELSQQNKPSDETAEHNSQQSQ